MRALVTGGSGFFGTMLVERLRKRGDEVRILDVMAPDPVPDGVEVVQARGRYVQAAHVLGELRHTIACSIDKARTDLGYEPEVSLLEGMRASIRWCLERGIQL